jgi:erythronate-4-phosphate dehydrogenase
VVDCAALKDMLSSGRGVAAALDVWESEPALDTGLLELVSIGTPHIAGYSADGKANGTAQAVRAVAGALGIEELADFKVTDIPQAPDPVYDVLRDDALLRAHPENFEKLRSDYPLRREPLYKTY